MIYNLYECSVAKEAVITKITDEIPVDLKKRLLFIEGEISKEFFLKQSGRAGITSLGNEIRYNKTIQQAFKEEINNNKLIKLTENKRSFMNVFIETLAENTAETVWFLILEREFGEKSKLVDKTFADISDIKPKIDLIKKAFRLTETSRKIYFIEVKAFSSYYFETVANKYSKIHKL